MPNERAEKIKDFMKGDNGGNIYNKIGLMASSVRLNRYFKFCPACLEEDIEKYGEIYWHRIHQVSGVLFCPKHDLFLQDTSINVRGFNKQEYIAATIENCTKINFNEQLPDETINKLIKISNDADILLNSNFAKKPIEYFASQYLNSLKKIGLANINGKIQQKELLKGFKEYFKDELLDLLQSNIETDSDYNWLTDLIRRKNKTSNPIRHLLLIQFLDLSVDELFNSAIKYKPFGDGPWPCLNPAAWHYKQDVIEEVQIKYNQDAKKPTGYFKCSCGYIYLRTGPDVNYISRYTASKVKAYGHVWMNKLKGYVSEGKNIYEISKLLEVDPATVKKYIDIIFVNPPCQNILDDKSEINNSEIEKQKKNAWNNLMWQYPNKSKTELRKMEPALYIWLYRNCNEWLRENSPVKKAIKYECHRVDWEKRDEEILLLVKEKIKEIRNRTGKPKRITVSIVGSELGIRSLLEKHLEKLPKTERYLNEQVENTTEFQLRRIEWAIKKLNIDDELKLWKILRKAGIRKEYQKKLEKRISEYL